MATANANIARHLSAMAAERPDRCALKIPRGRGSDGRIDYLALTFAELDAQASAWQSRLAARGVRRGDRTLVMVKPGLPLIASAFALFRLGAVPIIVDPGMGLRAFLRAVRHSEPRALLGIPLAQVISRLFRRPFRSIAVRVGASSRMTDRIAGTISASAPTLADSRPDELAAILFTSGSTGAPKGVCYEHGMFEAQVRLIREIYAIVPGEIDLPMLPIFALFNPALGMTTIVPEIDPRRPAQVDPAKIVQAIRQEEVTNSFGSPTLWRIVGEHCLQNSIALPSLRRVLCAGAPVPETLWQASPRFLINGQLHSPYGATEALPVSTIGASERRPSARGSALGRPVPSAEVRIIALSDDAIASIAQATELPPDEIGEIIVRGPMVTREYDRLPAATAAAKIVGLAPGEIWHRMGDCGYRDAEGRLWFCGRKAERVRTAAATYHTEPCERPFRAHPSAPRCALIGLGAAGAQVPALVAEAHPSSQAEAQRLASELRALGRGHPGAGDIRHFFFRSPFPVDVRHNAKIHRLSLARWAARNRPVITPD